jgi:hypothetical protein
MKRLKFAILLVAAGLLAACGSEPPPSARLGLKLAPAALGATISVEQHLKVERGSRIDEIDAVLEVDPARMTLVGVALGQRIFTLAYDGKELTSWRHLMLPKALRTEDVLDDLQLTLWPREVVAAALPPGWEVSEEGQVRKLLLDGQLVATITYGAPLRWAGTVVLDNHRYKYRLTVVTAP